MFQLRNVTAAVMWSMMLKVLETADVWIHPIAMQQLLFVMGECGCNYIRRGEV